MLWNRREMFEKLKVWNRREMFKKLKVHSDIRHTHQSILDDHVFKGWGSYDFIVMSLT